MPPSQNDYACTLYCLSVYMHSVRCVHLPALSAALPFPLASSVPSRLSSHLLCLSLVPPDVPPVLRAKIVS
eukprot:5249446-Pleurochrysis_carterae.AAC.1